MGTEEEGKAPAAGLVAPTVSAVKTDHTKMLSVWAKNIVSFADALVEAARPSSSCDKRHFSSDWLGH